MRSSAERFFRKTLNSLHNQTPRVINVDKNAVSPGKEGGFPSQFARCRVSRRRKLASSVGNWLSRWAYPKADDGWELYMKFD